MHLVGYLYYWQMGFNSVFKGLKEKKKSNVLALHLEVKRTATLPLVCLYADVCSQSVTEQLEETGVHLKVAIHRNLYPK